LRSSDRRTQEERRQRDHEGARDTVYLSNSGTREHAPQIAAHASLQAIKLSDRTVDAMLLDEIERIVI
jgi:hypothetical protein